MPLKSWADIRKDAEANASGFEPLESGSSYSFVIENAAKVGETAKGNPRFSITATVESGPRKNAKQSHNFNMVDNGYVMKRFFFTPLYAMGFTPSFFDNPQLTNEAIAQAFQGKRFTAKVEKQENSDYMQLVDFAPASGAAPAGPAGPGVPSAPAAPSIPQAAPAPQVATPAAPTAPAAPAAPVQAQPPVDDGNPWATSPPPPPVF